MCNWDSTYKEKERARTSISTTTVKHQEEEKLYVNRIYIYMYVYINVCFKLEKPNKHIHGRNRCWLFKQSVELKERRKKTKCNRPFTHCSQVDRFKRNKLSKKKTEWLFFFFFFWYKKKAKNFKKFRRKGKKKQALYTEEKNKQKKMYREDYFLRRRADEDRPVSVPVGSCCLELFDADCDGWIWWISFGVRRYTPRIREKYNDNKNE
jgi:hypothetical protein